MNNKTELNSWINIGPVQEILRELESSDFLKEWVIHDKKIVLSYYEGQFGALKNKCNHMGGPLSKGRLKKGCIECPWHYWQFNSKTGEALNETSEPLSSHGGRVSSYPLKIESDTLYINLDEERPQEQARYNKGSDLGREPVRAIGKIRVLGLSTTAMDRLHPRFSTSEELLSSALTHAKEKLDVETKIISLNDLNFRNCEGFYSKAERACTWPCSITKMDPKDEMIQVYESLVHWADVVIVSTPIRWGSASSLYYKMVERLNSVQNQITVKNKVLIKNKVAAFIITGGQDNIQAVAGQMTNFFSGLGYVLPPFSYVAHSLGWSSENMEQNTDYVKNSEPLHQQSFELVERSVELAKRLTNTV